MIEFRTLFFDSDKFFEIQRLIFRNLTVIFEIKSVIFEIQTVFFEIQTLISGILNYSLKSKH